MAPAWREGEAPTGSRAVRAAHSQLLPRLPAQPPPTGHSSRELHLRSGSVLGRKATGGPGLVTPERAAPSPAGPTPHICLYGCGRRHSPQDCWAGLDSGGHGDNHLHPQVSLDQHLDGHLFFLQPEANVQLLANQQPTWGGSLTPRHPAPRAGFTVSRLLEVGMGPRGKEGSLYPCCPPQGSTGGLHLGRRGPERGLTGLRPPLPFLSSVPTLDKGKRQAALTSPALLAGLQKGLLAPRSGNGVLGPSRQGGRPAPG